MAVCVNVSSSRSSFYDKTLVLQPSEHKFVVKESVVRYSDASMLDLKALDRALEGNFDFVSIKKEPCKPELLQKIQEGLLKSPHVSKDIQDKCRTIWDKERRSV